MENRPLNTGPKKFPIFSVLIAAFLIIVLILTLTAHGDNKKEITLSDFYNTIDNVAAVHFYGTTVYGIYKAETGEADTTKKIENFPKQYDFYITVAYSFQVENIQNAIEKYNLPTAEGGSDGKIQITAEPVKEGLLSQLLPYIYIILLLCLGYFAYKSISKMSGKNMDFGRSKARVESGLKVRFADVAGCDEEKQEMQEIVEFLKNPQKFTSMGARIPKGVMLVGPPGTGKTLLAKAIAGEAGVPFFSITGSDFVELYVGVGAARVRDLFETAKRNSPCLIFIDEIDAVGRQRGAGLGNTNDEREQTLNQLLVQMDGFESSAGIVVIAATNRPDVLDPALLRAGRFDRRIVVNRPDLEGRIKILKLYAKNKPFAEDIDWEGIARRLPGVTGADIENILNEAAILAVRDNRNLITETDIFEGSLKVEYGPQKKQRKLTDEDKKATAYHEAGHAIVIKAINGDDREVQEVTIIPRGMSGGMTAQFDRKHGDASTMTRDEMLNVITGAMGGRAAEKIIYGHVATGPVNDIEVSTNIAREMVTKYGMSEKLGPVCYASNDEIFLGRDFQQHSNISEATASLIDSEIKAIIEECEQKAIDVLTKNRDILEEMTKTLIEKQTIYTQEVEELMSGKKAEEVISAMNERAEKRRKKDAEALEKKRQAEQAKEQQSTTNVTNLENSINEAFSGKNETVNGDTNTQEATEKTQKEGAEAQKTAQNDAKQSQKTQNDKQNDENSTK